ncbi:MAG: GatB/YqeY domain-containing protein [Alphaproteobacteria bacterium]
MEIRAEINTRLKEALKNKDQVATSTIRLIMAALKDRDITARASGKAEGVDDSEILSMMQSMIKQRQESIKTYRDAGRDELAKREQEEITVIQSFMPKQLSDEEMKKAIAAKIEETGAENIRDMGKVMGALKAEYAGQMDMGRAGGMVKEQLG